jgi:hypothetical protein
MTNEYQNIKRYLESERTKARNQLGWSTVFSFGNELEDRLDHINSLLIDLEILESRMVASDTRNDSRASQIPQKGDYFEY